jgi:hypothetical protein
MDMQSPVFESGGGRFTADDDEDGDVHRNPFTLRGGGTAVPTGNFVCTLLEGCESGRIGLTAHALP